MHFVLCRAVARCQARRLRAAARPLRSPRRSRWSLVAFAPLVLARVGETLGSELAGAVTSSRVATALVLGPCLAAAASGAVLAIVAPAEGRARAADRRLSLLRSLRDRGRPGSSVGARGTHRAAVPVGRVHWARWCVSGWASCGGRARRCDPRGRPRRRRCCRGDADRRARSTDAAGRHGGRSLRLGGRRECDGRDAARAARSRRASPCVGRCRRGSRSESRGLWRRASASSGSCSRQAVRSSGAVCPAGGAPCRQALSRRRRCFIARRAAIGCPARDRRRARVRCRPESWLPSRRGPPLRARSSSRRPRPCSAPWSRLSSAGACLAPGPGSGVARREADARLLLSSGRSGSWLQRLPLVLSRPSRRSARAWARTRQASLRFSSWSPRPSRRSRARSCRGRGRGSATSSVPSPPSWASPWPHRWRSVSSFRGSQALGLPDAGARGLARRSLFRHGDREPPVAPRRRSAMIAETDRVDLPPGVSISGRQLADVVRGCSWPLNESGAFVLGRAGRPLGVVVRELAEAFDLQLDVARLDVLRFVWTLNAVALVNVVRSGSRLRRSADWLGLALRLVPAGAFPTPVSRRRPLDTGSVRRGVVSSFRASGSRVVAVATASTTLLLLLAAALGGGGSFLALAVALGACTGVGVGLHEAGHVASLRGVPSALVLHGRRTFVLHPPLGTSRRALVALCGPGTVVGIGLIAHGYGSSDRDSPSRDPRAATRCACPLAHCPRRRREVRVRGLKAFALGAIAVRPPRLRGRCRTCSCGAGRPEVACRRGRPARRGLGRAGGNGCCHHIRGRTHRDRAHRWAREPRCGTAHSAASGGSSR